jgi:hypothetical protein
VGLTAGAGWGEGEEAETNGMAWCPTHWVKVEGPLGSSPRPRDIKPKRGGGGLRRLCCQDPTGWVAHKSSRRALGWEKEQLSREVGKGFIQQLGTVGREEGRWPCCQPTQSLSFLIWGMGENWIFRAFLLQTILHQMLTELEPRSGHRGQKQRQHCHLSF